MCRCFVIVGVLLVVLMAVSGVSAADAPPFVNVQPAGQAQIDQANKFLAAETTRQIRELGDGLKTDLKAYQDENFMALDQRMTTEMNRLQKAFILVLYSSVQALFIREVSGGYHQAAEGAACHGRISGCGSAADAAAGLDAPGSGLDDRDEVWASAGVGYVADESVAESAGVCGGLGFAGRCAEGDVRAFGRAEAARMAADAV